MKNHRIWKKWNHEFENDGLKQFSFLKLNNLVKSKKQILMGKLELVSSESRYISASYAAHDIQDYSNILVAKVWELWEILL